MGKLIIAEVDSPDAVIEAARRARELGYGRVEAYTPFPIPELDEVLAIRRTRLPWLVLLAGVLGATIALLVQWWTNAFDYPINVGGRPRFSALSDVPIIFELTVLSGAFAAFGAVLIGARLPRLHDPMFDLPGFERTRIDRFWIVIADAYLMDDDILEAERATPPDEPRSAMLRSVQRDELAKLEATLEEVGAVVTRGQIGAGR
jgi:hypothetical protein